MTQKSKLISPERLLFVVELAFPDAGLEQAFPLKEFEKENDGCWQDVGVHRRDDLRHSMAAIEDCLYRAEDLDQEGMRQRMR